MSVTCQRCDQRYAMAQPVTDRTGLVQWMCVDCAAKDARPTRFPEGTLSPAPDALSCPVPRPDESDRAELVHQVELAQGKAEVLRMMLARMVDAFPELQKSYITATQQQVLRDVRATLEESK